MAGLTTSAQHREMKGNRESMKDLTPEQMATLQTKKMTLTLDLNDSQQVKFKDIMLKEATERKAKRAERDANKNEERQELTAEQRYERGNARLDKQIAHKKEMKNLLNAEQFAKWEKMHHRRDMHRKGKHQSRKGKNKSSEDK